MRAITLAPSAPAARPASDALLAALTESQQEEAARTFAQALLAIPGLTDPAWRAELARAAR